MIDPTAALAEHPLADRFSRLSPDHVLNAVEVGGRRCTGRFLVLNSYENRVFQLELDAEDADARGEMVVGKFYRPGRWSRAAIAEEHAFLAQLAEAEIPVACPIELTPGQTIGEVEGIYYSLFRRVGGRAPEELRDDQIRVLGRLLARIHNVGAAHPAVHRPEIHPATYGLENLAWLQSHEVLPVEVRDIYVATVEVLVGRIEPLFRSVATLRLHGDCHLGNLIWAPDGPTFIDFDDFRTGPAVQDVWLMVPSSDADGQRQREVMLDAYRDFRDFDPAELRLVEPLRALRYIHYSTWIAQRWGDGIFRRTFSHFGSLIYWQKEVEDLREQIARIDAYEY